MSTPKKYVLKPGRHQFAPGETAAHTNDNLTDEAAEWYLNKYPHIAPLFVKQEPKPKASGKEKTLKPQVDAERRGEGE
ncbi:hypothetical protein LJ707_12710 [Mucilaginibacter sp. UR6-1]|uniref:hypothetical protein n=1 Tax=Mucilaginibacter sp. UR6-1 TaxID=1435643 RepID=UPI001E489C4D|nr:hypothetical protein [Mucilaginibacter sp. UR6-1]MCC8409793.1 hypothetical protein [Mucilaginibacter sp. UR6-1]